MKSLMPIQGGEKQNGFALVAAVFIIVVLAILGVMMVTIGGTQRSTVSAAMQGARAYHAARSGVEWGVYRAVVDSSCAASTTIPLTVSGLEGFSVTVTCASTSHREGPPPEKNVYVIIATATSGTFGDPDYVSRRIQITSTNAP